MTKSDQTTVGRAKRAEQEATREGRWSSPFGDATRGQSSVIAVVLLIGLTVTGATAVLVVGSDALSETQRGANVDSAENALSQIDAKASRVAAGSNNTEVLTVADSGDGETRVEPDAGAVNITMENETTGEVKRVLLNESLGQVVYEIDGERLAFQGGGVWRATDSGSRMVSRPDVHYRADGQESPTATIPLTLIEGRNSSGDTLTISDNGTELRFPIRNDGDDETSNPIYEGRINMTVQSEYYLAWGDYLEQLTGGIAEYDHDENEVSIVLVSPRDRKNVHQGLFQTGTDTNLVIGAGGGSATTDSYNSSEGPYNQSDAGNNGTIATAGNIEVSSNGEVNGNIEVGGDIDVSASSAYVGGNISYGRNNDTHQNAEIVGWMANNASVNSTPPIRAYVEGRIERYGNDSNNDNDAADNISDDDQIAWGASSPNDHVTLPAGRYYINGSLSLTDQNITLDTTGGNVYVAVQEGIDMDGSANISVKGDNTARIFILDDFTMDDQAQVHVPDDNATQMWVYGTPETDVMFDGNGNGNSAVFKGVVYAPSTNSGAGSVTVDGHAEIYGGIVGGTTRVRQGSIHFDEALRGVDPLPAEETIPRVTHLHMSVNRVEITAD
ncbi:polymer-forming cytoskeletal protein [Halostella sp. JP-L12]|uniref:polymer-forming cytoskeletal protein n=1 Tax=Halostella TaxID=1843185 RepID=UPI000EF78486|nr:MULTISPECIES: polymer-forming cytoskeletal protein [Halostella]NHN49944.1 polymer-forming cytoskeletal protein [Halostella sp. JP-L12]